MSEFKEKFLMEPPLQDLGGGCEARALSARLEGFGGFMAFGLYSGPLKPKDCGLSEPSFTGP